MSWRMLTPAEVTVYLNHEFHNAGTAPMAGEHWSMSPCGVCIATWGLDLDYPIAVLQGYRFHGAVREALDRMLTHDPGIAMDYRHMADHGIFRGRMNVVAAALERGGVETCEFILSLQTDEAFDEFLTQARDMALAVRARYAAEAAAAELR